MMTGAILGGSSVQQAAKLQMIITFMISASTTLASILTTFAVIAVAVDGEDRVRPDRIDGSVHWLWKARENGVKEILRQLRNLVCSGPYEKKLDERSRLLSFD
jgi:hypothetical protein